jgi:hypothetical protein
MKTLAQRKYYPPSVALPLSTFRNENKKFKKISCPAKYLQRAAEHLNLNITYFAFWRLSSVEANRGELN